MFIDHNTAHPKIQMKMEAPKDFNEKKVLAQVSQIECIWEEVKG